MKEAANKGKENPRSTSSNGVVVRPWDSKEPRKEGCIKEAEGIIEGDDKKAGEGLIQDQKERSGDELSDESASDERKRDS
jgi:hypothetical protein